MEKQPDWTLINEGMEAAQNRHSGAMSPSEVMSELEKIRARPPAKYEAQRAKEVAVYNYGDLIKPLAGLSALVAGVYFGVQILVAAVAAAKIAVTAWILANGGIVTGVFALVSLIAFLVLRGSSKSANPQSTDSQRPIVINQNVNINSQNKTPVT